ncbi:hypothetical protein HDU76_002612 [Blyttiomyces sp. JEL0837]|nr:hypothetical protein HDU76_002612 [Blyttiomyces sp. JEL0837]
MSLARSSTGWKEDKLPYWKNKQYCLFRTVLDELIQTHGTVESEGLLTDNEVDGDSVVLLNNLRAQPLQSVLDLLKRENVLVAKTRFSFQKLMSELTSAHGLYVLKRLGDFSQVSILLPADDCLEKKIWVKDPANLLRYHIIVSNTNPHEAVKTFTAETLYATASGRRHKVIIKRGYSVTSGIGKDKKGVAGILKSKILSANLTVHWIGTPLCLPNEPLESATKLECDAFLEFFKEALEVAVPPDTTILCPTNQAFRQHRARLEGLSEPRLREVWRSHIVRPVVEISEGKVSDQLETDAFKGGRPRTIKVVTTGIIQVISTVLIIDFHKEAKEAKDRIQAEENTPGPHDSTADNSPPGVFGGFGTPLSSSSIPSSSPTAFGGPSLSNPNSTQSPFGSGIACHSQARARTSATATNPASGTFRGFGTPSSSSTPNTTSTTPANPFTAANHAEGKFYGFGIPVSSSSPTMPSASSAEPSSAEVKGTHPFGTLRHNMSAHDGESNPAPEVAPKQSPFERGIASGPTSGFGSNQVKAPSTATTANPANGAFCGFGIPSSSSTTSTTPSSVSLQNFTVTPYASLLRISEPLTILLLFDIAVGDQAEVNGTHPFGTLRPNNTSHNADSDAAQEVPPKAPHVPPAASSSAFGNPGGRPSSGASHGFGTLKRQPIPPPQEPVGGMFGAPPGFSNVYAPPAAAAPFSNALVAEFSSRLQDAVRAQAAAEDKCRDYDKRLDIVTEHRDELLETNAKTSADNAFLLQNMSEVNVIVKKQGLRLQNQSEAIRDLLAINKNLEYRLQQQYETLAVFADPGAEESFTLFKWLAEFDQIDPESLKFPPQLKAAMSVVDGAWDKAVKTTARVIKGGWKALKGLWGRG